MIKSPSRTRRRRSQRQPEQPNLPLPTRRPGRGGRRKGAGRKPNGTRAGVAHRVRGNLSHNHPVHVTTRIRKGLRSLRGRRCYRAVERALMDGCHRPGFRVVAFSVMSNHIHLLCEADSRRSLSRGMQGLLIRIARSINRELGRSGSVFADRYHDHVLATPREVKNAIAYVLNNARHHAAEQGREMAGGWLDPCSSAPGFRFWSGRSAHPPPPTAGTQSAAPRSADASAGLPPAHTWLMRVGWQRAGKIHVDEVPGKRRSRSPRQPGGSRSN